MIQYSERIKWEPKIWKTQGIKEPSAEIKSSGSRLPIAKKIVRAVKYSNSINDKKSRL
jgi:hypothetical protein